MSLYTGQVLASYDQCKRIRSPEECRQIASVGASQSVKGYLRGYDTCIELLGVDRCRQMLTSDRAALVPVAVAFFVAGFIVGRLLK